MVSAVTMQMGANIIDQYTSDNWPTVINFNHETYAGNKSLPYLNEFLQWTYRPVHDIAGGSTGTNQADIMMVCPLEFWNPYQNASTLAANGPTNLRVLIEPTGATNTAETAYWRATGITTSNVTNTASPFVNIATGTNAPSYEIPTYFTYPNNTADADKPGVLFTNSTTYVEPNVVTTGAGTTNSSGFVDWTNYTDSANPGGGSVSGFLAGYATNVPDARIVLSMATNAATAFRYKSSGLDTAGSGGTGLLVQFQDANGLWHPYQGYAGTNSISSTSPQITPISFVTDQGAMTYTDSQTSPYNTTLAGGTSCFTNFNFYVQSAGFADPRAYLWGMSFQQASPNLSVRPDLKTAGVRRGRNGDYPEGYSYPYLTGPGSSTYNPSTYPGAFEGMFNENASANIFTSTYGTSWSPSTNTYQADVDGIFRPGDGYLGTNANPFIANNATSFAARPIILSRPFRSVAEMGFAFRGQAPWKSINFFSTTSGDMGLLDVFGNDPAPLVAGKINLNTRQPVTIQAAIQGAYKTEAIGSTPLSVLSSTESSNIASSITAFTATNQYINRADLVRQTAPYITYFSPQSDTTIKPRREAVVRPLAELGTTRTWSLLIDVIAQVGHYTPTAATANSGNATTSLGNQFIVEGERRYWLHVAIDRVTGQVVDEQLELYNE